MKLKVDDKGAAVVQDGRPVYQLDDGKEVPFDAPAAVAKIKEVSDDRDNWRTKAAAAETAVKALDGIDPEAARKALALVANLDAGKLKNAEEVERIKSEVKTAADALLTGKQVEWEKERERLVGENRSLAIGHAFGQSEFVRQSCAPPASFLQREFDKYFKAEGGKLTPLDQDGRELYSRSRPGELATFDEAVEYHVSRHPEKDKILVGTVATGSGQGGSSAGGGTGTFQLDRASAQDPQKYRAAKDAAQKAGQELVITN